MPPWSPSSSTITIGLTSDYRLPLLLPREIETYLNVLVIGPVDPARHAERYRELATRGAAFVDRFIMTPWVASALADVTYRGMIDAIIKPELAHCRIDEYYLSTDSDFLAYVAASGVITQGFRPFLDRM